MKTILCPTVEEAEALAASVNKAMGYPMRSVNVGEGRHVFDDVPEEWDGKGDPPPGWCKSYVEVHSAEGKEFAIPIADNDADRIGAKFALLEEHEAAALTVKLAERIAVDLNAEGYTTKESAIASAETLKGK